MPPPATRNWHHSNLGQRRRCRGNAANPRRGSFRKCRATRHAAFAAVASTTPLRRQQKARPVWMRPARRCAEHISASAASMLRFGVLCPQLARADISPKKANSRLDPEGDLGGAVQKVAIANSTVDTFVSMDDELILALVEAGLGGWERYQARIGVARNFSSRVVISSGTTQNRWVALGSLARARPTQATDALIVNFARQQWGDLLAALAKSWRRIYI